MATAAQMLEAFGDIGYLQRGRNLLAKADPDLMRQIEAAVDAGDPMALRKIMAANIGLSDAPKARMPDMPYDMPPAKPSTDAVERRLVEQDLGPVGEVMPQPAVRTALDEIIAAGGGDELIRRLGKQSFRASAPEYSLDIFNNPSVLNQDITDLFPPTASGVSDVLPGAAVPSPPSTALIPAGPRGLSAGGGGGLIVPPGRGLTTTGGPRDLAAQGMESPAPRGLPAPNQPRLEGPSQRRIEGPDSRPAPRLESPESLAERRAMDDLARAVEADAPRRPGQGGGPPPGRNPPAARSPAGGGGRRNWLPAALAAASGAGAFKLGMDIMFDPTRGGGTLGNAGLDASAPTTADLAAEASPPPRVPVASGELTPREQAHELIARLNLMRRNAGGEVPEAPAMQREINRLLAMSNQTMAAASRGEVAMAGNDPHAQATRLLAQLNQMRREAGGEVPQARQIMAEVARLQQMGDAQRNARTTAFPRRAG